MTRRAETMHYLSPSCVAEVFAPGWKAEMEKGAAVAQLPVNIAQRALAVPAGVHEIAMRYDPFSFRLGVFVAYLCMAALAAAGAAWLRMRFFAARPSA